MKYAHTFDLLRFVGIVLTFIYTELFCFQWKTTSYISVYLIFHLYGSHLKLVSVPMKTVSIYFFIDLCLHVHVAGAGIGDDNSTSMCFVFRPMMTSSNGNIYRVTGHLCGEFTGPGEFPAQRPVARSFDVFFDLCLNKRLCKQWWGWWFETISRPLWCHCNTGSSLSYIVHSRYPTLIVGCKPWVVNLLY